MGPYLPTPIERFKEDHEKYRWRSFWCLILLCVLASLASIPYSRAIKALSSQSGTSSGAIETSILESIIWSIGTGLIMGSLAIWVGLWLSSRANLGAPLLVRLLSGKSLSNLVERKVVSTSILIGLAVGVIILGLCAIQESTLPLGAPKFAHPSALPSLFGSFSASVIEEIIFRLGAMSLIVSLFQSKAKASTPSNLIIWTGIFVTSLLFGLVHLPMANKFFELTPIVVGTIMIGNGITGVTFGWLFWRYGLIMAMVAHFFADIVLQVIGSPFD